MSPTRSRGSSTRTYFPTPASLTTRKADRENPQRATEHPAPSATDPSPGRGRGPIGRVIAAGASGGMRGH